jgi:hypothetical protein
MNVEFRIGNGGWLGVDRKRQESQGKGRTAKGKGQNPD